MTRDRNSLESPGLLSGVWAMATAYASKALGPLAAARRDILVRCAHSDRALRAAATGPRPFIPPGTAPHHEPPQPTPSLDGSLASLAHRLAVRWLSRWSSHPLTAFAQSSLAGMARGRPGKPAARSPARQGMKRWWPAPSVLSQLLSVSTAWRTERANLVSRSLSRPCPSERSERGYPAQRPRAR